jgi:type I restriction enzyme S subunit
MQYSVVNYKEVLVDNDIFRFDADYFYLKSYNLYKAIKNKKFARVKENFNVTKLAGFEYTKYFTDPNINSDNFYIVLTSKNIQNEELVLNEFLKIDKKIADEFLKRSNLKKGDVVLSYTGEYRRALVLEENDFQLGPNICLIRSKNKNINPYYLSTFLNSNAGQLLLDREKTLSAQPTVAMSRIREIPIPILDTDFQNKIGEIITSSKIKRKSANNLYSQAEQLLLAELGILGWKPKHELAFVKNFSAAQEADRFDAEYFQPKYEEIIKAVRKYKGGSDIVKGQFKPNKKSFKNILDKEYQYIEIGCVNISDGSMEPMLLQGVDLPANAKIKFQKGDVVVSRVRPYRGAIGIVGSENYVGSGAFTVLQENGVVDKETLLVYLRLKPLLDFSLKFNTGTSYPTITDEDILNFPLPKIDSKVQDEIKKKIGEMYEMKKLSKSLLEIAKRGVEMAIEKDEQEAEKWIRDRIKSLNTIDSE